uniref:ASPIC/UnbV domain-containing protein n=1 Tax=Compsopogon caeruleus TaxID=31354 RepID=A0A7S1T5H5_9RHOD|mmetsp:Transcript_11008/g.21968  ORF Transcript_11008/g.21968 Transcript_11008/m.21968 type:complete len:240 (+) Transcript_11008:396-1115(+)|eukprot:CAMPEP_0184688934 /NCGR_PEP_ID=MMETSP0312-20130426/30371_1 /TAXON_ID=31354 /ORGANISM="Compsopogon coeruleus, Strain SAG 36.94" /LENGTH=239 /DNA_ID=CAMNT_0027146217 /DNA_START=290 /DNA_END=1009 /DNA_ORIENTATION=+
MELDYNNDGKMDLYITCGATWMYNCDDVLLKNTGIAFVDVSREAGIPLGDNHAKEGAVGDFNLDGFVDIFIPAWGGSKRGDQPNLLLVNQGNGTFQSITAHGIGASENVENLAGGGAGSFLSYEEGRLDIIMNFEYPGPWKYFKNLTPKGSNQFLVLKVDSDEQVSTAVGARVEAWIGNHRMTRRVGHCPSLTQSVPTWVHFGLGMATYVDRVQIFYVGGLVRVFQNVSAGFHAVSELF